MLVYCHGGAAHHRTFEFADGTKSFYVPIHAVPKIELYSASDIPPHQSPIERVKYKVYPTGRQYGNVNGREGWFHMAEVQH